VATDHAVYIREGYIDCDYVRFQEGVDDGSDEALRSAVDLYQGDFLSNLTIEEEGWSDWISSERTRLRMLLCDIVIRLVEDDLERGASEQALALARKAVAIDNFREDIHRLLMRSLAALGRRNEALRHFDQVCALLRSELDVEPEAATAALAAELRTSELLERVDPFPKTLLPPERPSIAVLPFDNFSDDPQQAYFVDGVVEDITTALSRLRWLFVIARNSTFAYRGQPNDVRKIGQELGVRYVLEGSIRKTREHFRISAQLIEAETRGHIWADQYDGKLEDVFEVQDRVTSSVVSAIEPNLHAAEVSRSKSCPPASLGAYDLYLRALPEMAAMTQSGYEAAESHLRRAMDLDPDYADAIATLADCLLRQANAGWMQDTDKAHREARDLSRRAAFLEPANGSVLATAAWALAGTCEWDEALDAAGRALKLQPNSAFVRFRCGAVYGFSGECEQAISQFQAGWRLNPKDPRTHHPQVGIASAHFFRRQFEETIHWARRGMAETTAVAVPRRFIAAALGHLNRTREARTEIDELLKVQPNSCLERSRKSSYRHTWMLDLYIDGLRKAGLPERARQL
jgi:adenylate cyclase